MKAGKEILASLALCVIALLAYSNSFHTGFALDNAFLLREDRIHALTAGNIGLILGHTYWWPLGESGLYRPFTTLSYLFNYAVLGNGADPEGYHWINFILHAGNIVLAFVLALRLVRKFWPSVFIAGLWGMHPVLTESVTNIVGRADLFAGMAVLGGFLIYLKATEATGWRRLAWFGGLAAVTTVGAFSKESAVTVVGVIALYELTWWKERGEVRSIIHGSLAILPPLAVFLYQRSAVLAAASPTVIPFTDNPVADAGFWTGRLTALKVMAHYLELLLWPARLSSDYSYPQIPLVTGTPGDWIAGLTVCGIGAALILLYRREPAMFYFGWFAFGTFLPTSNLLFPIGTIMAERLLYLPAYGLIACLVLAVYRAGERIRMHAFAPTVLVFALMACSVRTWGRNPDWSNDLSLFKSAVRASPQSYKAHIQLSHALFDADARHSRLEQAIDEGERGIALIDALPDVRNAWPAYRQLGLYYLLKGDSLRVAGGKVVVPMPPASKLAYERLVQLMSRATAIVEAEPGAPVPRYAVLVRPNASDLYLALSTACLRLEDTKRAYDAAVQARDLNPGSVDAWRNMAYAMSASGREEEAITALMEGQLLTGDLSLSREIAMLYRTSPNPDCTITQGRHGPEPNLACAIVHDEFCAAEAGAMRVQLRLARPEQARQMMNMAVEKFGCAIDPLEKIMTEPARN